MIIRENPSYPVSIFIAGAAVTADRICHEYCQELGFCVTVTETRYIYRDCAVHGTDDGVIVGLINYPRYPETPAEIWARAEVLAARLCDGLSQQSYTIQAPDKTVWFSHREQSA